MAVRDVVQAAAGNTPAGDLAAAIDFDGTNDYLSRVSDLTGAVDGKTFTFSAWVYIVGASSDQRIYHSNDTGSGWPRFAVLVDDGNRVIFVSYPTNGTARLNISSATNSLSRNTWYNILASVDMASQANSKIYINDANSPLLVSVFTNTDLAFANNQHYVGAESSSAGKFDGRLSNVFLDYTYRDLSVTNNRRLFITEDGKPADGQASLNPIMYMPLDDPEDIGYNAGTGGDFTVNGVMARSGRGPNQDNCVASYFDGTNDYLNKTSISIPASKTYTLSFNVSRPVVGNNYCIWAGESASLSFYFNSYNGGFFFFNSSGANVLTVYVQDVLAPTIVNRTVHVDLSFDLTDSNKRHLFIDGVDKTSSLNWSTYTNDNVRTINNLTVNAWDADPNINPVFIGEYYLNNTYTNLATSNPFWDSTANRPNSVRKVIEDTGVTPLVALPIMGSDAGKNLGTGGDFTVNSGPYPGARGASEFIGRSVSFNGTNQSLTRATTLTGAKSAGSGFTFALSVKVPSTTTYFPIYVGKDIGVANYLLFALGNNKMYATVPFYNYCDTDNNSISGLANTWINVLFTVTKNGSWQYWINGVDKSEGAGTFTATSDFDFTSIDTSIIGTNGSADYAPASLGFFWATDEYIDFSQEATRLKFFDGLGYPVDLGEDGSIPTGNQPLIYMNNNFHLGTNSGGGGNFSPDNAPPAGPDVGS